MTNYKNRLIYHELKEHLSKRQITVITGLRRTGKTTLVKKLLEDFTTLVEAQAAPRVDPGRITVSDMRLWVRASRPVQVAEERYIVTFGAYWYSQPGTFRIIGKRLSYEVICDITVPLGR